MDRAIPGPAGKDQLSSQSLAVKLAGSPHPVGEGDGRVAVCVNSRAENDLTRTGVKWVPPAKV